MPALVAAAVAMFVAVVTPASVALVARVIGVASASGGQTSARRT